MTKKFKKAASIALSVALLSTAVAVTLPWTSAQAAIPDTSQWQYSMVQDFNSLTDNVQLDYWQSGDGGSNINQHKVGWLTTAKKGADDSEALYVHTLKGAKDNGKTEISINRTIGTGTAGPCGKMNFNTIDVTSPTEVWMWVDFTGTKNPERFRFVPYLVTDGKTVVCTPKDSSPIYFQTSTGWKESAFKTYTDGTAYPDLNNVFVSESDLTGFKGYIRMPLTSFDTKVDGAATTIDWTKAHITSIYTDSSTDSGTGLQTAFYFKYDESGNLIDDGFYLDNILVTGTTAVGNAKVSDLIPQPAPDASTWKVVAAEDFDSMTAAASYENWGSYCKNVKDSATAGVGYRGSQGLYVHSTAAATDTGYSQPFYYINKAADYSGAQELWIWYDFTKYDNPGTLMIRPRLNIQLADGTLQDGYDIHMIPGAPVYYQSDDGTVKVSKLKSNADPKAESCLQGEDLAGFKGFVRLPLSSFTFGDINMTGAKITGFVGGYWVFAYQFAKDTSDAYVENGFVMDDIMMVGPDMNSSLTVSSIEVPDASAWKVVTAEDFNSMTAGASYENWGSYCKNVKDAATDGVGCRGSQGLYVHSTAAATDTGYSQPFYYVNKAGDYSGAQELWIWYDFTKYNNPGTLMIRPRLDIQLADGTSQTGYDIHMIPGAPVYYQSDDGTLKYSTLMSNADPKAESCLQGADLAGFKGFVRIPLSSFTFGDINMTGAKITNFVGGYWVFAYQFAKDSNEAYVENGFVMDDIMMVGPNMNSSVTVSSVEIPDASGWQVGMVEDFEGMTAGKAYGNWGSYCKSVTDAATAGVGFRGSQGLYIHSTGAAADDNGYSQPWYAVFKKGDFSGAKELWIYYDYSNYGNPANMEIRPRINIEGTDDNIDLYLIKGAPVFFQSESGTFISYVLDKSYINGANLAGFKGFIRIPLSSFKPDKDIDLKTAKITQFAGMYNVFAFQFKTDDNEQNVETGYVMDNIALVGPGMNSTLTVADMFNPPVTTTTESTTTETSTTESTISTETTESTESTETTESTESTVTEPSATETSTSVTETSGTSVSTESTLTSATSSTTMTTVVSATTTKEETTAASESTAETTSTAGTTGTSSPTTGHGTPFTALVLALLAASGSLLLIKKKK